MTQVECVPVWALMLSTGLCVGYGAIIYGFIMPILEKLLKNWADELDKKEKNHD